MKKLKLSLAEITEIRKSVGDACYLELESGYPYALVGPVSRCLFLVCGENVGPISQYILSSENSTNYLSELREGSKILSVSCTGETKDAVVKKSKVERTSCILLKARCEDVFDDKSMPYYRPSEVSVFIQDSEESRLVNGDCRHASVRDLSRGSKVLVYTGLHGYGRHFGTGVENIELIEQ